MSTAAYAIGRPGEIACDPDLHALLCGLEADSALFQPDQLKPRLVALDELDAGFGGLDSEEFSNTSSSSIRCRAKALRTRLEAANAELYRRLRAEMIHGAQPHTLLQWMENSTSRGESGIPLPGFGFDCRDELVSGILQLREPGEPDFQPSPEMVPYQPTPVRHILHLIEASALAEDDVLVDLGSGLGHVPLLVSILARIPTLGIEVQPAYVASARECAQSLQLSRVRFVAEDARAADMSSGTVFYLYSPFTGSILIDVLSRLRRESTRRRIKICSLGPCTRTVANQTWLKAVALPDQGCITVFESR